MNSGDNTDVNDIKNNDISYKQNIQDDDTIKKTTTALSVSAVVVLDGGCRAGDQSSIALRRASRGRRVLPVRESPGRRNVLEALILRWKNDTVLLER